MKNQPETISNEPLADFCRRFNISRKTLSEIAGCNGASPSSMQRLLHNRIDDADYARTLRKALAKNLPDYLLTIKGLSSAEIDRELFKIFDKGEYQPMINKKKELPVEVAKYFGFQNGEGKFVDPFAKPRKRQEVFISQALKAVVDIVIDAIKFQKFIFISGEIGSGKSILRSLVEDMTTNDPNLRPVFVESSNMGKISSASIERAILDDFGVEKTPIDAGRRFRAVKKLLAGQFSEGVRVGVCIDEAHTADRDTISSFKNLLEMSSGGFQYYLGVILFGQPQFETRLTSFDEKRDFREIYERLTIVKMPDFKASAREYLSHRLSLVGVEITDLFDSEAIDLIVRQSKTPLQLGNITNQALILSCNQFKTKIVKGAAIKTKMHFTEK